MHLKNLYNQKILGYVFLAICLGLVIRHVILHKEQLTELSNFSPIHIVFWVALQLSFHVIAAIKIYIVQKGFGLKGISYGAWLKIYFMNKFIDSNVSQGGKLYRLAVLKKNYNFSYTKSISVSTFMTWYESTLSLGIMLILISLYDQPFVIKNINVFFIILPLFLVALVSPFVGKFLISIVPVKGEKMDWLKNKFTELAESVTQAARRFQFLTVLFSWALFGFLILSLSVHVFFDGLGTDQMTWIQTGLFTATIVSSSILKITPNNLGIIELITGLLAETVGISLGNAIVASGGLRILLYLTVALIAFVVNKFVKLEEVAPETEEGDS